MIADGTDRAVDMTQHGDVVIARRDIGTSYHLSVVVDDALDEVSLVTRGADLEASTHVHRLLQALLELPTSHIFIMILSVMSWHSPREAK